MYSFLFWRQKKHKKGGELSFYIILNREHRSVSFFRGNSFSSVRLRFVNFVCRVMSLSATHFNFKKPLHTR